MKDVQKKLLAISKTLSSLVKQVEKMASTIKKGKAGKTAPVKKRRALVKKATAPVKKKTKAPVKKAKVTPKKRAAKKSSPAAKKAKVTAATGVGSMLDSIFRMISRSRAGITVEKIKKRTDLEARQVSNALYKLTKKGKIETLSRGVYVKKKT